MGDDAESHARTTTLPRGTLLSAAIEQCSPEIKAQGWSWVAVVDRAVAAVWSIDHGAQLLISDRKIKRGPVDTLFRDFTHRGETWAVRRADTMLQVFVGGGAPIGSIRPHALGEAWLVGTLGASVRVAAGLPDLPDIEPAQGLELTQTRGGWVAYGAPTVQVTTVRAARVARLVFGRSVAEVRRLLEV